MCLGSTRGKYSIGFLKLRREGSSYFSLKDVFYARKMLCAMAIWRALKERTDMRNGELLRLAFFMRTGPC